MSAGVSWTDSDQAGKPCRPIPCPAGRYHWTALGAPLDRRLDDGRMLTGRAWTLAEYAPLLADGVQVGRITGVSVDPGVLPVLRLAGMLDDGHDDLAAAMANGQLRPKLQVEADPGTSVESGPGTSVAELTVRDGVIRSVTLGKSPAFPEARFDQVAPEPIDPATERRRSRERSLIFNALTRACRAADRFVPLSVRERAAAAAQRALDRDPAPADDGMTRETAILRWAAERVSADLTRDGLPTAAGEAANLLNGYASTLASISGATDVPIYTLASPPVINMAAPDPREPVLTRADHEAAGAGGSAAAADVTADCCRRPRRWSARLATGFRGLPGVSKWPLRDGYMRRGGVPLVDAAGLRIGTVEAINWYTVPGHSEPERTELIASGTLLPEHAHMHRVTREGGNVYPSPSWRLDEHGHPCLRSITLFTSLPGFSAGRGHADAFHLDPDYCRHRCDGPCEGAPAGTEAEAGSGDTAASADLPWTAVLAPMRMPDSRGRTLAAGGRFTLYEPPPGVRLSVPAGTVPLVADDGSDVGTVTRVWEQDGQLWAAGFLHHSHRSYAAPMVDGSLRPVMVLAAADDDYEDGDGGRVEITGGDVVKVHLDPSPTFAESRFTYVGGRWVVVDDPPPVWPRGVETVDFEAVLGPVGEVVGGRRISEHVELRVPDGGAPLRLSGLRIGVVTEARTDSGNLVVAGRTWAQGITRDQMLSGERRPRFEAQPEGGYQVDARGTPVLRRGLLTSVEAVEQTGDPNPVARFTRIGCQHYADLFGDDETTESAEAAEAADPPPPDTRSPLARELAAALNSHNADTHTDTPDFLLAEYLVRVLAAYTRLRCKTREWHGELPPGDPRRHPRRVQASDDQTPEQPEGRNER